MVVPVARQVVVKLRVVMTSPGAVSRSRGVVAAGWDGARTSIATVAAGEVALPSSAV
jgi:hypothetical protein